MTDAEKQNVFIREVRRLSREEPDMNLTMNWSDLTTLVALVQLALRHPGNKGRSALFGRNLVHVILTEMERLSPALAAILAEGNGPHTIPE